MQDVLALKGNGASDHLARLLQQSHNGIGLLALSGAGLSHHAHDLAVVQVIGNAAYRLDFTGRRKEGDLQIFDFQQFRFLF